MIASAFGNWAYLWLWTSHGVGNFADDVVLLVLTVLIWPRLRHKLEAFMKRHVEAGNAELHAKLDHLIRHSPDVPDFPSTKTPDEDSGAS